MFFGSATFTRALGRSAPLLFSCVTPPFPVLLCLRDSLSSPPPSSLFSTPFFPRFPRLFFCSMCFLAFLAQVSGLGSLPLPPSFSPLLLRADGCPLVRDHPKLHPGRG